jgi:spermidine synthase
MFDVIIMDILDPIEAGPGIMLYTKEFYKLALTRLNMPGGVFVTQSGTAKAVPAAHHNDGTTDLVQACTQTNSKRKLCSRSESVYGSEY